jgi:DNA (cytosine-5)-methyltransferase 1
MGNPIVNTQATIDSLGLGTGYGTWRERSMGGGQWGAEWQRSPGGLLLPPEIPRAHARYGPRPIGVDLFCGCGGMGLGFTQAGWNIVAASDSDPFAAMTYLYNLGAPDCQMHFLTEADETGWWNTVGKDKTFKIGGNNHEWSRDGGLTTGCLHFWLGDVRQLTGDAILTALGLEGGDIDCVTGGPPCQGFSSAGKRNVMDPRNSLVFEFARLCMEIKPKSLIMENVPAMLSMRTPQGRLVIEELVDLFEAGGWDRRQAINALVGPDGSLPNHGVAYGPRANRNGSAPSPDEVPDVARLNETRAERRRRERKEQKAAEKALQTALL